MHYRRKKECYPSTTKKTREARTTYFNAEKKMRWRKRYDVLKHLHLTGVEHVWGAVSPTGCRELLL
jgi:hypothetical protein